MPISTSNLAALPDPIRLQEILRSMAVLDAIISPEWEFRYYSFDKDWSHSEQMGSMRDGTGDSLCIVFTLCGCCIFGSVHERQIPEGLLDQARAAMPKGLIPQLSEPAFSTDHAGFIVWHDLSETGWRTVVPSVDDGSKKLLSPLDGRPKTYQAWASEYYETQIPIDPIVQIYQQQAITQSLVTALNPDCNIQELFSDLSEIGYSVAHH